jgi:hypothetical protein
MGEHYLQPTEDTESVNTANSPRQEKPHAPQQCPQLDPTVITTATPFLNSWKTSIIANNLDPNPRHSQDSQRICE